VDAFRNFSLRCVASIGHCQFGAVFESSFLVEFAESSSDSTFDSFMTWISISKRLDKILKKMGCFHTLTWPWDLSAWLQNRTICYSDGWRWRGRGGITASSGSKCEDKYVRDCRRFTVPAPSTHTSFGPSVARLQCHRLFPSSYPTTAFILYLWQRLELVWHLGQNEGEKALMQQPQLQLASFSKGPPAAKV
jgi:hypothetical protein